MKIKHKEDKWDSFIKRYGVGVEENKTKIKNSSSLSFLTRKIVQDISKAQSLQIQIYETPLYERQTMQIDISYIPNEIRQHIVEHFHFVREYSFSLETRQFRVFFILSHKNQKSGKTYRDYLNQIAILFYVLLKNSSQEKCAQTLNVYLYMTQREKKLPQIITTTQTTLPLDMIHANTAFTYSCAIKGQIILFREEEWFKVLIHESFHAFGLDFSQMPSDKARKSILKVFKVDSEVNLFEAYSEFWADVIHVIFYSYFMQDTEYDLISLVTINIHKEIEFGFFQMVKVLNYYGLKYNELFQFENAFREKTNVLSYYVLRMILLSHYSDFIRFCLDNTPRGKSVFNFKKTQKHVEELCEFIKHKSQSPTVLKGVKSGEELLIRLKKSAPSLDKTFWLQTMRMTILHLF